MSTLLIDQERNRGDNKFLFTVLRFVDLRRSRSIGWTKRGFLSQMRFHGPTKVWAEKYGEEVKRDFKVVVEDPGDRSPEVPECHRMGYKRR